MGMPDIYLTFLDNILNNRKDLVRIGWLGLGLDGKGWVRVRVRVRVRVKARVRV